MDIIDEACEFYIETLDEIDSYASALKKLSRSQVQKLLTEHKIGAKNAGFRKGTKCPCLSGKRIKDCLGQ